MSVYLYTKIRTFREGFSIIAVYKTARTMELLQIPIPLPRLYFIAQNYAEYRT